MEFRVLGPLEVVVDGRRVALERRLTRALLAYLLLHANEPVSAETLVDRLWPREAPRNARASLQNYVTRLRKALGADVPLGPAGYVLQVDPERFDLAQFERLVGEARDAPAARRSELLRAALALWRGPPLADLAYEEWAQAEIGRLEDRRLAALEARIAADLECGSGVELVEELQALVAAHPFREGFHGGRMLALYRAGRQADALAAYTAARHALLDELGLEPSDELRRLQQKILTQDPALDPPDAPAVAVESRRTVTVLVCNLVDSSQIVRELDPEALRRLMSAYFEGVRGAVAAHGGLVQEFIGGAVVAVFGLPELHEDDALRAVRAASEARAAVADLEQRASGEWGVSVRARAAVATGEVLALSLPGQEGHVIGPAVAEASDLQERAAPGEVVLAEATYRLVRHAVDVDDARRLTALVPGASPLERHLDAPLVGRGDELARLRQAFDDACRERRCRVVTVLGEAGIGKTRLVRELVATVQPAARVLVGRCSSYGAGATYLPLREIVRAAAPEASPAGVQSLLGDAADAEQVAQQVAQLVGFAEGAGAPGEAFWAVRRVVESLAGEKPLVLVLDDVHWAEPTLLDLVEYLGGWAAAPVLLVCAARPDLREDRPAWGGPGASGFVLELSRLADGEVAALLDRLAGDDVGAAARARIVAHSGGNPLFAEQLVALAAEAPELSLDEAPPTVEALIAGRLDRLDRGELGLLRRAAVVGRRFLRAEVEELGPLAEADLAGLLRRGLVHRVGPAAKGRFRFHHVLVRDVAYRGTPKAERAELHERAADSLDRRRGPDELVGYHYEQAFRHRSSIGPVDGRARRLAQAAGERLAEAGIRAWKRADAPAAVNLLGRAGDLLPEEEVARRDLLAELGLAVWAAGDADGAERTLRDAIDAASSAGDRRAALRGRLELAGVELFREGSADEVLALSDEALPAFEQAEDDRALGRAWAFVTYIHGGMRCRYALSEAAGERALTHYRRSGWGSTGCMGLLAAGIYYGPTPVPAGVARCEQLLEQTELGGRAHVLTFLAGLQALEGKFQPARGLIAEAGEIYEQLGWTRPYATGYGTIAAEIESLAGEPAAAEALLRAACETLERMGERVHGSTQAAQLADVLYELGAYDEAERWASLSEANSPPGDVSAQCSWRSVRAKLMTRRGELDAARTLAEEAVALAEPTDTLNRKGTLRLDLAEVLRLGGAPSTATPLIDEAMRLFEAKGSTVLVDRARARSEALLVR